MNENEFSATRRPIDSSAGFKSASADQQLPYLLRNSINIMMAMPVPACIIWGTDNNLFHNDSFIPFIGGTHPALPGTPLAQALPELYTIISESIDSGMEGNETAIIDIEWPYVVNHLNRCRLSFTPLANEQDETAGLMITITEEQGSNQNNEGKFRTLLLHSPMAMVVLKQPGHIVEIINDAMLNNIWHKTLEQVQGKKLTDIFLDNIDPKFIQLLDQVCETGLPYKESEALMISNITGVNENKYVDFEYTPFKNNEGKIESIILTVIDVTEKVEARKEIEDAEERLRLAADGTGLAMWDLNLKTDELISSPRLSIIFGEEPDKMLKHTEARAKIHPDDLQTVVEKAFQEALITGTILYEARVIWNDLSIHWIKAMGKVQYDKEGKPERMLGTVVDITEQVRSRILLQDSEARFRTLVKGLPFAVYYCNKNGGLEFYNDAAMTLWGRTPVGDERWCGSHKVFDLTGRPVPTDQTHTARCVRNNIAMKGEAYVERPNGDRRHVLSNPQPIHDAAGNIIGVMNALIDVTEMKKAQQAIIESELRFRTVANTAPVMIWMSGTDKKCYFCNTGWLKFTGRTIEEEIGDGWIAGIHPDDIQRCNDIYDNAFDNRIPFYNEYRLRRHDGVYRWVSDNGVPRYNADGMFEGFIGSCADIHDQKISAEKLEVIIEERTHNLRMANVALERSNEELEQFAFVTSHDLQEPLRKINTFAHLLYDRNKDVLVGDGKMYIDKIMYSAQRMSRLINDLLNFSRLNRSDDKYTSVDLNALVDSIRNDFELMIIQKNALIDYKELPVIEAIPLQMNQLLYNLIGNALKFTNPDRQPVINISGNLVKKEEVAQYVSLDPNLNYCKIIVSDNGIGFKQEYAQKIFEIFQRLNGKSEYEGTGIGLALCNKIVTNHKGLIFARSEEGKGTEFHIFLPVKQ